MQWLGITLLVFFLLSVCVSLWFSKKIQNSLEAAERLLPLVEKVQCDHSLDVVIPAYNEEDYIVDCVKAVLKSLDEFSGQGSVWIADDQSLDATLSLAQSLSAQDSRVKAIAVPTRPTDLAWQGKNWACHYVSQQCRGDYILFIDADMLLQPACLKTAVHEAEQSGAALLTLCPQVNCSFWVEWLVQPPILSMIVGFFNFREVNSSKHKEIAFGFGPFMMFDRQAYDQIGGHESVAEKPVEDMALASAIKTSDLQLRAMFAAKLATVRMYSKFPQLWEGWTKNFHTGFGSSIKNSVFVCFLMFVMWTLPQAGLIGSIAFEGFAWNSHQAWLEMIGVILIGLALSLLIGMFKNRAVLAEIFPSPMKYGYLTFLGGILVGLIAIASIIKTETGWGWTWRGRSLAGSNAGKT